MCPTLWNLRPYEKTSAEITRIPRLIVPYQKVRKEAEDWGDYKKLPEEIPEFPLIRGMLLGADSVVQTAGLRAFETNEQMMEKFSESMDPINAVCTCGLVDEEKDEQCGHTETWKIRGRMGEVRLGANCNERQSRLARSRINCGISGNNWEAAD